jgi:Glucoamylase and related glycosyl hydrolases
MSSGVLDNFEDLSGWTGVASGQAQIKISQDQGPRGKAMRLDFDFKGGGGFVVARKPFVLPLPEAYAFSFNLRGPAPPNRFEFKLVDPTGHNVWWYHHDAFDFPEDWRSIQIRSSQIEFAWGPLGGGAMGQVGVIEFVIGAGPGDKGTVWIDDLCFQDQSFRSLPAVRASSALPGHEPEFAVDHCAETSWRSKPGPQWFLIDFQQEREYGGLIVQWEPTTRARGFDVQTSNDGAEWKTIYATGGAEGSRSFIYLAKSGSRYLRLNLHQGITETGFGIVDIDVQPYDFSRSIHTFFQSIAKREPRGLYPKYLYGEQTYWSPVGIKEGFTQGLLNEEGMVEVDKGSFSIEPFLYVDEELITWADVSPTQELEQGYLPIPSSVWRKYGIVLKTTAFVTESLSKPILYVRYRVEGTEEQPRQVRFFAALRPFQVTPPWQAFNALGGVSPIRELAYCADAVWVDRSKVVIPLTAPSQFGAATFDQGTITEYLKGGELPPQTQVSDGFGYASGALRYDLGLARGAAQEIYLAIPFGSIDVARGEWAGLLPQGVSGADEFGNAVRAWETKLGWVEIRLPPTARGFTDTFKTAAAHILINRDGPALQPGPRRYTRSWIRDGATMAAALLRVGCNQEVRDFIRWYAQHQAEDGNVPCCVDRNGPDWLPEYDSQGEFIYAIMECFRFTGDRSFLAEMWPAVVKSVDYIEALRGTRLTPQFQTPEKRACYGLLPESVSHEGYLAHPVHAYWDDFWALRGLKDAANMAEVLSDQAQASRLAALCDSFRETLRASIEATMTERYIDYIPGSVEWADFDPAATANAIALLDELPNLPGAGIEPTFDQYLSGFRKRCRGEIDWTNYSPYEIRIVGALVRLGKRESAHELLEFFGADRRPRPWNQWTEIAWRDPKSPAHIGDMPHTWIAAEYILSFRSMFAFEREADQALIIAAGLVDAWLTDNFEVVVKNLPTYYGKLSYSLRHEGTDTLCLSLFGDPAMPPGKIVVRPPLPRPIAYVKANGKKIETFDAESVTISQYPVKVVMKY